MKSYLLDLINKYPTSWESILEEKRVKVKREGNLAIFNYDILADFTDDIVRESRGIIIDMDAKKVVCYPFIKFCNYGEAGADDIDWKTARVEEKVDGCFTADDSVMLADGTKRKISLIVDNKENVEVLSYNFKTNKIEPKKVIGWNKSEKTYPITDWLSIKLKGVKQSLNAQSISQHCFITPTKNHMIYKRDEENKIIEVRADELKVGDRILTPAEGLTSIEKQVILGTLLGDGSCTFVRKNSNKGIQFQHSIKQKEYVKFKAKLLSRLGGKERENYIENSYGHEKYIFTSHAHKGISAIYDLVYDKDGHKKITEDWLKQLDWLGFSIWYMDDGSLQKGCLNNSIHLHTEGFSDEEQNIIVEYYNKLGYKATIQNPGKYHIINFSTEASERIWQNIRQYIIPEMQYKLPERHKGYFQNSILNNQECSTLELFEGIIENIEEGLTVHNTYNSKAKRRYDIEVEDNHNYFCGGILVHNSIIKVWYYGGEWRVSTNGVIDARKADISISTKEFHTFYDVFAAAASNVGLDYNKLDKNKTYIFELVSPANRVVVNYNGAITLYHIGTRDMITGLEEEADIGVPKPKTYPIHTLQDCLTAAAALNEGHEDIVAEGFVVKDANYHRIKIKDPKYVAVHRILPNGYIDDIKILELVKFGDLDELLTYIPSLEKRIKDMEHAYEMTKASIGLNYKVDKMFVENHHISRKEYALKRKDDAIFSILIKSIYDNADPIELFEKMSTKKQMDIIKRTEGV